MGFAFSFHTYSNKYTLRQTKKGQTMNYKLETFKRYFDNEREKAIRAKEKKQIKRDLFIVDLIDFIGFLFVLFFTYWIIIRI